MEDYENLDYYNNVNAKVENLGKRTLTKIPFNLLKRRSNKIE